jgi:hypothetical protein
MSYILNIHSSRDTINEFIKQYKLKSTINDSYLTIFKEYIEKYGIPKKNNIKDDIIKIGSYISIAYTPLSQKYIDDYDEEKIEGVLFFITDSKEDGFVFLENGDTYIISSIVKPFCSYYGDSNGYFETIEII